MLGKLIYLSLTRSDDHMEATYRVLRYLKGCLRKGMLYKGHGHLHVEIYTAANWVTSLTDCRSTSSYCSFVGEKMVTRGSRNSPWLPNQVLRLNLDPWLKASASHYG